MCSRAVGMPKQTGAAMHGTADGTGVDVPAKKKKRRPSRATFYSNGFAIRLCYFLNRATAPDPAL